MAKRKRRTIQQWLAGQPEKERTKLQGVLAELDGIYQGPQDDDFTRLHRVGKRVAAFFPEGNRRYGGSVIELLASYLDPEREEAQKRVPNYLYRAREFANAFSRRESVRLAKARNGNGDPLTALHAIALLQVKDEDQREDFLTKCLQESWSGQRLRREVQNMTGRKRSHGGRKPQLAEPQSCGVALRNISLMSRRWMVRHQVWFEKPSCPFGRISKPDCNEAILREAEAAVEWLEKVHEAAGDGLGQLTAFVQRLEKMLSM